MPSAPNTLAWIFDVFDGEETYLSKPMFGALAAYVDGRLCLVASDRDEPWNGLLVCTSQDHHAPLVADLPALRPHPVLGKWLYVPEHDPAFEHTARRTASLVLARDERIGVEPRPKRRGGRSVLPKTAAADKGAGAGRKQARQPVHPDGDPGRALDPFTGQRAKTGKARGRR